VTGQFVADLCLDGGAPPADASGLSRDRFDRDGSEAERNVA
jgi:hypothetical protein